MAIHPRRSRCSLLLIAVLPCVVMSRSTGILDSVVSVADHGCQGALDILRRRGGGTLLVPRGEWSCAPMNLTSHLTVYLEAGATLKADPHSHWPLLAPLSTYHRGPSPPTPRPGPGKDNLEPGPRWAPFLNGFNVTNLTIRGGNGTIDGSGAHWWSRHWVGTEIHTRPSLFECVQCEDIVLEDTTFKNSGFWTIHPVLSKRVTARRITVLAQQWSLLPPAIGSPNTDGFDPDSTSDVLLEDSYFAVDDDAIAIKAGWDCAGYGDGGKSSNNITIRNVTVWHGGGGISIGSEMSGGVSNVLIENVLLQHGSYGLFVKTADTRGGFVENVTIRGVEIVGALKSAVTINGFYGSPNPECTKVRVPTHVRNITIMDVVSRGARNDSLQLAGLSDVPTVDIMLSNVTFDQSPFKCYCAGGVGGVAADVTPALPVQCGLMQT